MRSSIAHAKASSICDPAYQLKQSVSHGVIIEQPQPPLTRRVYNFHLILMEKTWIEPNLFNHVVRIDVSLGHNISGKLADIRNNAASLDKPKALIPVTWGAVGAIIAIMAITVLEFPSPIGFETRPQTNVSPLWGLFFLIIMITDIAAIPLIFRRPGLGRKFGIVAGILNILQVIADQAHLLQPEVAPLGYSVLEGLVVIASLVLIYFCLKLENK